jgi:deoxyribodipyrimidine photolyase
LTRSHSSAPAIVWFRDDQRLADNPALAAAQSRRRLALGARTRPLAAGAAASARAASPYQAAGLPLAETYPRPIVDHDAARRCALRCWKGSPDRERHAPSFPAK